MKFIESEDIENIESATVEKENIPEIKKQAEEMIELCVKKGGSGLSAIQVGIYKKFFIWPISDNAYQIAINPKYISNGHKKMNTIEGCLSYPDTNWFMKRWKYIRAIYYTVGPNDNLIKITKNLRGEAAIIYQHETDHGFGKTVKTDGELLEEKTEDDIISSDNLFEQNKGEEINEV